MFLWKCMLSFAGFVVLVGIVGAHEPGSKLDPWDKQFFTCIHEANEKIKNASPCSTPDECKATLVPLIESRKQYIAECMTANGFPMKVKEEKK